MCIRLEGLEDLQMEPMCAVCGGPAKSPGKYSPCKPGFPSLVESAEVGMIAFGAEEIRPRQVRYLSCGELLANSFQRRGGVRSRAAIVAVEHLGRLCERPHY